ncbi:multiple sugar transport system substrate-binding protein [Fontibacillus solani]|uniref:Multiple sugar transport system substrate-binding protein n=1 Tax=Fontibacillus solani TaxID=1572857 RepID=A0A7W3SV26_9BACL|nr:extracellular solute-binding protein [Fontibacillus solani]MBA9086806.1 multiple sugar transport system substrate-binding protein [Fontibacillus solani]
MRRKGLHKLALLTLCSGLLLAGCTSGPAKKVEQQSSIKVMFWDESYFFQQYGDLFTMRHPNINIEVLSTQSLYSSGNGETDYEKAFKELVEKEQPDVLMLNTGNFETFASEGKLQEIDTLIGRDKYDTETIYPGLIDLLKEKGEGKLYGLSPSFYGNVIYYNADLFEKYGVEVPHDGMTWQEILDTARRFPTDGDEKTRIYGYGNQYGGVTANNLADQIARTQGLQSINPDTMKITLNTDSWKQAYKLALDAIESKALYNPENGGFQGGSMEEYYQSQPFLMGRMAMTVESAYLLQNMKEAKNAIKDYKPFKIGMAAGPVDPASPDKTRDLYFNEVFSIRANSPNVDAAWEFIKFINGEEYAKVKSRAMNNGLLSRMGFSKEFDGQSLDVFYKLKPVVDNSNRNMEKIPSDFYAQYQPILDRELGLVKDKSKSLDEALKTIQDEAQVVLDKAVKDQAEKKQKGDSGEEGASSGQGGASTEVITITK